MSSKRTPATWQLQLSPTHRHSDLKTEALPINQVTNLSAPIESSCLARRAAAWFLLPTNKLDDHGQSHTRTLSGSGMRDGPRVPETARESNERRYWKRPRWWTRTPFVTQNTAASEFNESLPFFEGKTNRTDLSIAANLHLCIYEKARDIDYFDIKIWLLWNRAMLSNDFDYLPDI